MALNGKNAVVTGAVMGIGKAITEILLQNGAKVALLDVNETAAKGLMKTLINQYGEDKVFFMNCDVESEKEIKACLKKAAETFGGIDILCNNAGILNEGLWEKMVSINLMGVIKGSYLALEHMNKLTGGRGGVIVNTASMAGIGPLPSCPAYTAVKHGVVGFTRAMAAASTLSGYGIRFNVLCPAFVQTDLFSNIPKKLGIFSELCLETQQLVEHFGVLDVSDVAEAFLELVTDETKNGQALLVLPTDKDGKGGNSYITFPTYVQ
ncbi:15-hydroxyprostaglandin dehydrogenase [NAD(+)]-like [Platichthys flesus]|uniref:15-hydroxyprostaglandin dehydrogenase [NAD(+)]-like n=1 Tax=Platichthys flesus TaxID=8260 RepID=UPI001A8842D6|nr:15-hydroxyprostaglandin dehydrogenase [NAD(+)]-like [Platichthys flesus]